MLFRWFGDSKESKRIKKICTNVYLMTLRWIMFWFLFVISLFLCSCLAAGCVRAQLMLRRVFNHRAYQLVATEKSVQSVLVRWRHCWGGGMAPLWNTLWCGVTVMVLESVLSFSTVFGRNVAGTGHGTRVTLIHTIEWGLGTVLLFYLIYSRFLSFDWSLVVILKHHCFILCRESEGSAAQSTAF